MHTSEAAILLDQTKINAEARQPMQSVIEHEVAVRWRVNQKEVAIQVLIKANNQGFSKLQLAQANGFQICGDKSQALLQNRIDEVTHDSTKQTIFWFNLFIILRSMSLLITCNTSYWKRRKSCKF